MSFSRARKVAASFALLAGALVLCASLVEASIEKDPVRVTNRNSGPRYDIDEVERTRLNAEASDNMVIPPAHRGSPPFAPVSSDQKPPTEMTQPGAPGEGAEKERDEPIGHITIRRIFMVPLEPSSSESRGEQAGEQRQDSKVPFWLSPVRRAPWDHEHDQQQWSSERHPLMFGRPHLFGADEASRPALSVSSRPMPRPTGDEREMSIPHSNERPDHSFIDPLQMMIQMVHQVLNQQPNGGGDIFSDLSKEASANRPQQGGDQRDPEQPNSGAPEKPQTELESTDDNKPQLTRMKNETREDIVEIDGKKFLRKTVTSKHVGENVVFMTKRLIFTPLNETTTETTPPTAGESEAAPEISRPLTGARPTATDLPDKTKDEPVVATGEPTSVSAAPPSAELATEMPSIPTTETKPRNPEAPPKEPESVPARAPVSEPAPTPASGQAQVESSPGASAPTSAASVSEQPSIPTVGPPPSLVSSASSGQISP